ncbi:MAG: substrate-binding domain-containing protein, partial [Erysipelotrichaceae bacterium]|nr:substrate-binding domain-containing protein [Erysipelotrichaceae bacterium]
MNLRRKVIAVCGAQLYEEKEFGFLSRLNIACREIGWRVLTFDLSTDPRKHDAEIVNEKPLIDMIHRFPIDALIIMSETFVSPAIAAAVKESVNGLDIPVFSLDRPEKGCINIVSDFGNAFADMVRHVIHVHGCRKINMIAGLKNNSFSDERIRAYKEVLAENGIPFEEKRLAYGDFWDRPAREAVKSFIDSGDIPEAIVCANDAMAISACSVLQENGFRVPEDVIVTGFDGIMSGRLNYPPISTIAPNYVKEVELILELVSSYYDGNLPDTETTRYVDYVVRENRSCGCVNDNDRLTAELVNKLSY